MSATARAGWLALLAAVTIPHLTVSLGSGGLSVLMPLLQRDLGLSTVQVGVLAGARFTGLIALSIPAAAMVTRLGLRRSVVFLQVGFGLTTAALAAASGPMTALLAVAASSAFFAAVNPATTTAVVVRFPMFMRAQAMNTKQMGVPLGTLLAALILPAASAIVGWRGAFVVVAGLSLVSAAVTWVLYTEGAGDGAATAVARPQRTTPWGLLRHRPIVMMTALQAIMMGAQVSMLAYLMVFLVGRGVPLGVAAGYMALLQLTGVCGRMLWGVLADHVFDNRRRPALASAVAASMVGVAALAVLPEAAPGWMLASVSVLLGLGLMAYAGMIELVRAELVVPEATAAATGIAYTLGSFGGVAGPPLVGLIAEYHGYPTAWAAIAAALVVAIVLALLVAEPQRATQVGAAVVEAAP
jgi:MFS family permease